MDKRKWMKITAVIVCIVVLAGVVLNQTGLLRITTANADLWEGEFPSSADESYTYGTYNGAKGNGSERSPYYITSARDLAQFVVNVNAGCYKGKDRYFRLVADINLNSKEWTAIGTAANPFDGHFIVADNCTITNMKLTLGGTKSTDQGFFGYLLGAEVKGLKLSGNITMDAQTGENVGGIAGNSISSSIEKCSFTGNVKGNTNVGGIVGFCTAKNGDAVVNGCTVAAGSTVEGKNVAVGGVAGAIQNGAVVLNCSNFAPVSLKDSTSTAEKACASGLVGYISNAALVNSFNAGSVQGGYYASGITAGTAVTILNCYNKGSVSGDASRTGAISGKLDATSTIMNNVFYLAGTAGEDLPGGFTGNNIQNVGYVTAYDSALTKASWVPESKWTIQKDATVRETPLLDVLGDYVSNSGTDYKMYEWAPDGAYRNEYFPILSDKIGHKHNRDGKVEVKVKQTCTDPGLAAYYCSEPGCTYFVVDIIEPDGHKLERKVTDPTCTTTGAAVDICQVCGARENYVEIPARGHLMDDYTKDPSCEVDGYQVRRCTRAGCGYEDEASRVIIQHPGHQEDEQRIPADCMNNEKRVFTCSVCHNVRTVDVSGSALGHAWDFEDGQYRAVTCVQDGGMVRTCNRCQWSEILPGTLEDHTKAAHAYQVKEVVPAKCETQGYTVYACSVCAIEYTGDYVNAKGHDMYEDHVVEATCQAKGYTVNKCTRCDYTYNSNPTEMKSHIWTIVSTTPQSCLKAGRIDYKCQNCDETYFEAIPMIGQHNHQPRPDLGKEATCTEKGYTIEKCTQCGDEIKTEVNSLGHSYEDQIVPPDCLTKGYTLHKCVRCDDMYRDTETGALGHAYVESIIEPTTTTRGYTSNKCSRCDDEKISNYIAATPNATFNALERRLTFSSEEPKSILKSGMHIAEADVGELMKYSLDGGKRWVTTEAVSVILEEEDLDYEKGIDVVRPGNDVLPMADSYIQHIELLQAEEPDMLTVVKPSIKNGTGSITGVNELMEYRAEEDKTWTPVEGDTIENLKPGVYYVRTKATVSAGPSKAVMVIVEEYEPQTSKPPESEKPENSAKPSGSPATSEGTKNSETPQASAGAKPSEAARPSAGVKPSAAAKPSAPANNSAPPKTSASPSNAGTTNIPHNGGSIGDNNGSDKDGTNKGGQNTTSPTDDSVVKNNVYYSSNGASKSTGTSSRVTSAKTGDETPTAIWLGIAGVSLAAFAFVITKKRREEAE